MKAPRISATVCTHNGAALLGKALDSLALQTLPGSDFEVLIVDNASTDSTRAVAEQAARGRANVRYIFEGKLGLSAARNTAARAARSPYIAYLDDDAQASAGWLAALLNAFERLPPAPACVGGLVTLDWEGGPIPNWVPRKFAALYSCLDLGPVGHYIVTPDEYLIGANMAFQLKALLENSGFDENLGRKGPVLISGEESALLNRFRAKGLHVYYAPDAAVSHFVHEKRRSRKWLIKRVYWDGASQPWIDYGRTRNRWFYAMQSLRDLRLLLKLAGDAALAAAFRRNERSDEAFLELVQRWGRLRTHLRLTVAGAE